MAMTHCSVVNAPEHCCQRKSIPCEVWNEEGGTRLLGHDEEATPVWSEVTDSEKLIRLVMEWHADNLQQAMSDGTPFASDPISELFGLYRTNSNADAVL